MERAELPPRKSLHKRPKYSDEDKKTYVNTQALEA